MVAITKLSEAKLEALYLKRDAKHGQLLDDVIAAGYGSRKHSEIPALAAKPDADPLLVAYVAACDARQEVFEEQRARQRYHGSLQPIRRKM